MLSHPANFIISSMSGMIAYLAIISQLVIGNVKFVGNRHFSYRVLMRATGLKKGGEYRELLVKSGELRLRSFYTDKGFFHFRVDSTKILKKRGKVTIIYYIFEGKRAVIGDIDIEGAEDRAITLKFLNFKVPVYYDGDRIGEAESRLLNYFADHGYPFATVTHSLKPIVDDTFLLRFKIDPGPLVLLCDFDVQGLKTVRREIVMREIDIPKCSRYSITHIMEVKRRIYSTWLFSYVGHEIKRISERNDTMKATLVIKVQEQPKRRFNLGIGYYTPLAFQIRSQVAHNNLFGNNQRINVSWEIRLNFTDITHREINIEYTEPYFLGLRLEGHGIGYYYFDADEITRKVGASMEMRYMFTRFLKFNGSLNWEKYILTPERDVGVVNSINLMPFWDTRDNILNPTTGTFVYLNLIQAGGVLGGIYDYRKVQFEYYRYIPRGLKFVFASRIRLWYEWPFNGTTELPVVERFTMGGYGSMRGYDERSIGPIDPERPYHSGRFLFNANIEFRFRPWKNVGVILFSDIGNLWEEPAEATFNSLKVCVGTAVVYYSPIAPFRLDWGIKLTDRQPGDHGRLYFGIGQMF